MTVDEWAKEEKARITFYAKYVRQMGLHNDRTDKAWLANFAVHQSKANRILKESK
jgi:hypothetical protein